MKLDVAQRQYEDALADLADARADGANVGKVRRLERLADQKHRQLERAEEKAGYVSGRRRR